MVRNECSGYVCRVKTNLSRLINASPNTTKPSGIRSTQLPTASTVRLECIHLSKHPNVLSNGAKRTSQSTLHGRIGRHRRVVPLRGDVGLSLGNIDLGINHRIIRRSWKRRQRGIVLTLTLDLIRHVSVSQRCHPRQVVLGCPIHVQVREHGPTDHRRGRMRRRL